MHLQFPQTSHSKLFAHMGFTVVLANAQSLLMCYLSRSDKSKHLGVIWKKLAQHMRNVDSFVAAKLEAGANEHADLTGTAVPYILFYPAGKSEGMKFAGEPSLKAST